MRNKRQANQSPRLLRSDHCGDAFCPNCGAWLAEYHVSTHSIDEDSKRVCPYCGQPLVWDIDWDDEMSI